MASFLCQVQTIQRSLGRSAVAAAAYRSGQALTDDRLAMEFDFSNKDGIEHAEIMAPDDAPQAYRDRAALWNAVEAAGRRKDAMPAQEASWRCRTNLILISAGTWSAPLRASTWSPRA